MRLASEEAKEKLSPGPRTVSPALQPQRCPAPNESQSPNCSKLPSSPQQGEVLQGVSSEDKVQPLFCWGCRPSSFLSTSFTSGK